MRKDNSLKNFIIKYFLLSMVLVAVSEIIVGIFMNLTIEPVLKGLLFKNMEDVRNISVFYLIGAIGLFLLQVIFYSISLQGVAEYLGKVNADLLNSYGVQLSGNYNAIEFFLLVFLGIVSLIIYLIPFVVVISIYASEINKKVISLEKEQEQERKEREKRRNLMLSDIAHDLRTPITTVNGYAKALADGLVTDPVKQQEYLDAMQKKSARMEELIKILFDYVKLDSDGFTLNKEELDLCELLRENAALLYSDIEDAGMELEVEIAEKPLVVEADKVQISRVVTNLMVNAMRHNPKGTKISLQLHERLGIIYLEVADNGSFIPEAAKETLFDPFSKADQSRSNSEGSGLGLSIARKIIEMHGWELNLVEDIPNYTKSFEIRIL